VGIRGTVGSHWWVGFVGNPGGRVGSVVGKRAGRPLAGMWADRRQLPAAPLLLLCCLLTVLSSGHLPCPCRRAAPHHVLRRAPRVRPHLRWRDAEGGWMAWGCTYCWYVAGLLAFHKDLAASIPCVMQKVGARVPCHRRALACLRPYLSLLFCGLPTDLCLPVSAAPCRSAKAAS